MKRWLKKHAKWLVVGSGVLFIGNASYGIFVATEGWQLFGNIVVISVWVVAILLVSGAAEKLFKWWEKD